MFIASGAAYGALRSLRSLEPLVVLRDPRVGAAGCDLALLWSSEDSGHLAAVCHEAARKALASAAGTAARAGQGS